MRIMELIAYMESTIGQLLNPSLRQHLISRSSKHRRNCDETREEFVKRFLCCLHVEAG